MEAAPNLPPRSELERKSAEADHHKQIGTTLVHSDSVDARLNMLAIKPLFLAWVHEATWQAPDAEMRKLVRRARVIHAQFHVGSRHGLDLVFRG